MRLKKQFEAPRVLQSVNLLLEDDLLAGQSAIMTILGTGQEVNEYRPDEGYDNPWLD